MSNRISDAALDGYYAGTYKHYYGCDPLDPYGDDWSMDVEDDEIELPDYDEDGGYYDEE